MTIPDADETYRETFAVLGINDARRLRRLQTTKALKVGKRFFVISFAAMTEEAQNTLLKVIEEPSPGTYFFFITSKSAALLPTFLSRCETITPATSDVAGNVAGKFYQAAPAERLALVGKWLDEHEDNHKTLALNFLDELEKFLAIKIKPAEMTEAWQFAFAELRQARYYLQDKSGLPRQILEHLALVIPIR